MTCWWSSWDAKVPFAILCSILVNNSGLSHPFLLFFLLLSSSSEGNISEWVPIGNYHVTKIYIISFLRWVMTLIADQSPIHSTPSSSSSTQWQVDHLIGWRLMANNGLQKWKSQEESIFVRVPNIQYICIINSSPTPSWFMQHFIWENNALPLLNLQVNDEWKFVGTWRLSENYINCVTSPDEVGEMLWSCLLF